ncbi:MAG: mucoidy inhibitor MuiA family protein, partial [Bacteroidota bacterium]
GKGAFVVTDVKHRIKYPEPVKTLAVPKAITKQIKQLEDSLTELDFRESEIAERLASLSLEKDMIVKNKLAKGEGKSDSLEVLIKAMEFFHKRLGELNALIAKAKRDKFQLEANSNEVTQKLNELRAYKDDTEPEIPYQPDNQVVVTISADAPATGVVELSYMVSAAGWTPSYDLRASNTTEPVKLTYKANVYQSTGEDWKNVRIKLSTSNPNRSHIKPSLPIWYINYYTAQRATAAGSIRGARPQSTDNAGYITKDMEEDMSKRLMELSPAESAANYSQIVETMANVEFAIKLDYDIPSDGNSHVVSVKTESLAASYVHYLVPKIESEAFLLARVTGWENLNLLPGNANLFYDGTYVGQTVINPNVINDTLDLAMGRDQAITVTRTRMKDKESNKLLGTDITKTVAYELR